MAQPVGGFIQGDGRSYFLHSLEGRKGIIALLAETVDLWVARGFLHRNHGCIVVMDPRLPYRGDAEEFSKAIFIALRLGNVDAWEHPYDDIALAKAKLSWRTGFSTREVIELYPHLLEEGDVRWAGGIVFNGWVVAYSGDKAYLDEAVAYTQAAMLTAGARSFLNSLLEEHPDISFLGDEKK